jgi:hypothetical protein
MGNEIFLRYEVECGKCGEPLDIDVEPAHMVIKASVCLACANKMADEYRDNLREKIIATMLRDDAYSPALSDKVITMVEGE